MKLVFGCDFSGAADPSKKIFFSRGQLVHEVLNIEDVVHCEDRLDLFHAITTHQGCWGMDMPFSLPHVVFQQLHLTAPRQLYQYAAQWTRMQYKSAFQPFSAAKVIRHTDVLCHAKSPLSRTPIDMLGMTYGGFKLLHYLHQAKVNIYPFCYQNQGTARLFEVYPSHTWKELQLARGTAVESIIEAFRQKFDFRVSISKAAADRIASLPTNMQIDALDSVIACITVGYALYTHGMEYSWTDRPGFAAAEEWEAAATEGLIVRL